MSQLPTRPDPVPAAALYSDLPFIITEWRTDSAKEPQVSRMSGLSLALGSAIHAAADRQNARVQVTDDSGVCYAQFAMLWMVPGEYQ